MHIQAYFGIFTLIIPSKPIRFINIQTAAGAGRSTQALFFRQLILPIKVVASHVGQWKVLLQQARDPSSLMRLLLHVFAKLLFCFWELGPLFGLAAVRCSSLFTLRRNSAFSPSCSGEAPCRQRICRRSLSCALRCVVQTPAVGAASASSRPSCASSPLATWMIGSGSTLLAPRQATMKTQCIRLWLFEVKSAPP